MDERGYRPSQDPQWGEAVGRTIKVLRTDRGMSRKDLAEAADISYSYLTEIENGNKPPSNTVLGALAAVLGVRLHELIADAEDRVAPNEPPETFFDASGPPPMWDADTAEGPASPSARRERAVRPWAEREESERARRLRPTYATGKYSRASRDVPRSTRELMRELEDLLPRLRPEDLERVLDLVRRLLR